MPRRLSRTLEGQQLDEELCTFGFPVAPAIGHRAAFVRAFADRIAVNEMKLAQSARQEIKQLYDFIQRCSAMAPRLVPVDCLKYFGTRRRYPARALLIVRETP
jgi:hypothetical protein